MNFAQKCYVGRKRIVNRLSCAISGLLALNIYHLLMRIICLMTQFHIFEFPKINSFCIFPTNSVIFNNLGVGGLEAGERKVEGCRGLHPGSQAQCTGIWAQA